jgi:Tfp pilus assembly protein PilX
MRYAYQSGQRQSRKQESNGHKKAQKSQNSFRNLVSLAPLCSYFPSLRKRSGNERGVALVVMLLILSMTTALGLAMYVSTNSDLLINGFYRNFHGSFYAADSGLNLARAQLLNQVVAAVPTTFAVPPIANPANVATNAQNYLTTNYGNFVSLNASQATNSWKEQFKITSVTFSLAPGSPTVTSRDTTTGNPTGYSYIYNYSLTAMGAAQGTEQASVSESGSLTFGITAQATTTTQSFASFGTFVDQYAPCFAPLVPGTMTGPMFTNGAWQFTTGSYIFTDPVGQANAKADYWFGSTCIQSATSSYTMGRQTIRPTFQGGFNLGRPAVPLPPNDFSQKRAVLDGIGTNTTSPTNTDLNAKLKNISGTAYPSAGATSGVYLAYSNSTGPNVMTGGGIYVEGNAQVTLSPSGGSAQVFSITQGSTTTTVTVDRLATPPVSWNCPSGTVGTTTITSGSTTTNVCSVPMNYTNNQAATMLYVDGAITGLTGPAQGQAAIQDGAQITIAAKNDVTVTGDVLYKTEPVTTTQNQVVPGTTPACCNGSPTDTLIPGHDNNQVLGIFTATGNFNLNTHQSGGNIQVDGAIATISQGGTGGFKNTGPAINTFNNVGSQTQNSIYSAAINTENIYFDRRFTNRPGFAPPWFPETTITTGGSLSTNITSTVQRVQWLNKTTLQ